MEDVGTRFSSGEYFLAELILSAEIFKEVVARLEPLLSAAQKEGAARGAVVIGTPKGDIHDIGKNIAATLFKASGFDVHDLGVDVAPEAFVEKIAATHAGILAMSALITPTFGSMKRTVELLKERGMQGRPPRHPRRRADDGRRARLRGGRRLEPQPQRRRADVPRLPGEDLKKERYLEQADTTTVTFSQP